jgi:hypothetical protein
MKLLLDENLPKKLLNDLGEHEVYTVAYKKWNGVKNGELLKLMISEKFDALITFDRNMQYQQNFRKYTIAVLVFNARDNTYNTLKEYIPKLKDMLRKPLLSGVTEIK